MAPKTYSVCGIEIGKESLCVVHYVPSEKAITGIAIQPFETGHGPWWDTVQAEFRSLIASMKVSKLDVVCSLPAETAVIKRFTIDAASEDPHDDLEWELGQNVIGLTGEFAFDFEPCGQPDSGAADFLVAAGHTAAVERVQKLVAAHRLNPVVVDLDIFALANAFEAGYPDRNALPTVLVLGGEEYTKLVLMNAGRFVDYESFKSESESMDPLRYTEMLQNKIGRLLSLNEGYTSAALPSLFAAGSLFGHADFARECLGRLGGTVLSPFNGMSCRAVAAEELPKFASQLAVAVGLAVRGGTEQPS